jgi:DNA-binding NtrC family response regulator
MSLTVASTLAEARRYIAIELPDLVITDLLLPDGIGTELLPTGREEISFPVIIMTSYGDEQVAVGTMKAGALDYVVKSEAALAAMPRIVERVQREWGYILERRRAEEETHRRNRELTLLNQVIAASATSLEAESIMEKVCSAGRATGFILSSIEGTFCFRLYASGSSQASSSPPGDLLSTKTVYSHHPRSQNQGDA